MGFPDNYTDVPFAKRTNRFQGTGNSWAVPVVRWLGERLFRADLQEKLDVSDCQLTSASCLHREKNADVYLFDKDVINVTTQLQINVSATPERIVQSNIADIIDVNAEESLFISPVGCKGILRRADERGMRMNPRLETIMRRIVASMDDSEIERISRIQPRGSYSLSIENGEREKPKIKRKVKSRELEFDFENQRRVAE